jgi:pyrroloquinoline quinone (PQQ) biosynthesis protein C
MEMGFPLLRRSAVVQRHDGRLVIEHLSREVTLEGPAAALLDRLLPHLDGQTSLGALAEKIAERPERLTRLAQELNAAGVLAFRRQQQGDDAGDEAGDGRLTGAQFYDLHRERCAHWLRPIYSHPLWAKIVEGRATRAQVLGFAFEKYHYIEGAYEHMAIGAANATPEMMPHLARHFIEEYNHGDIYRKGLQSLFPDEVILSAQPLPSTRALVNFLSESAARNSFAYYAGNELLQMTENTGDTEAGQAVIAFYEGMRKHYPFTERLIASFQAHTHADQKLGHDDVFQQMCASVPPLSAREVRDALEVTRSMAEHLRLFLDGIDVFYQRFPAMPRGRCTLLSE